MISETQLLGCAKDQDVGTCCSRYYHVANVDSAQLANNLFVDGSRAIRWETRFTSRCAVRATAASC